MSNSVDRRRFLKVLGVTGAGAAAVSACGIGPEPTERLIPYLIQPEDQIPGTATYYATTCRECAAGCGVRVRVREGRAVKLEGNPDSPINRGRLCARGQAALQGLYNPDRIAHPMVRNASGTFEDIDWEGALQRLAATVSESRGKGVVFLTGAEQSSFGDLGDEWMKQVGGRRMSYEPVAFEAVGAGSGRAVGTAPLRSYAVAGGMAMQYPNGAGIVAAVNILNYVVGAVGTLVKFGADLAIGATNTFAELATLTSDMAAGRVALLFVHGTNPAHSLPGAFQQALGKVAYKVSFSSYLDETAAACDLILPDHHPLEQWGATRPRAGITALQQPVVQPVFDTRPTGDVILKLAGKAG